jgi:hypothetical protein
VEAGGEGFFKFCYSSVGVFTVGREFFYFSLDWFNGFAVEVFQLFLEVADVGF